jgi:hypothetical protein
MTTMKRLILLYFPVIVLAAFAFSCESLEETPRFPKSDATLTATPSATTVAVTANDTLAEVLTVTWNDPGYAVGLENTKFSIRVGLHDASFAKFFHKDFTGVLSGSMLGKELNGMALGLGGEIGQSIDLDLQVMSSQENNNEPKVSNVIKITVTPFADLALNASTNAIVLSSETADEVGLTLSWSAAFKGFDAVKTYQFEYAKGGTDFANPIVADVIAFSKQYTQKQLNDLALGFGIAPGAEGTIDFRIKANNELDQEVYSNVASITVTPYATSFPPLYGMGEALKGWGPWPGNAVPLVSKEYKKYETIAYFNNGKAFRFFEQLDWGPTSYNYPFFTSVDPLFENASDGDSNLKFIGTSGWYKVNVDLNAKTVTMAEATEPQLYMTGAAINGWDWSNPVKMTYIMPGVFEADVNFSNETFRFFAQADWGPTSYNYPYFTVVDANFENADDGDKNLRFVGTPGTHHIIVDLENKVVSLDASQQLYMTGAALQGWNWDNPIQLTEVSPGVFEGTATFTSGETFRFFAQADWGPTSFNYPYFTTVDDDFENANDGDKNLKFIGTTGSHKVTVNFITKTVTLQ